MARELTAEEVRERFLGHVRGLVDYWLRVEGRDERRRMEGLAFSVLAALDGDSCDLPAFIVAPLPHADDREFRRDEGEDWFPENHAVAGQVRADIAGRLHEHFYPTVPDSAR
jgi:hypothetical protein